MGQGGHLLSSHTTSAHRFRAKREHLQRLSPKQGQRQGHNLALTVLYVPNLVMTVLYVPGFLDATSHRPAPEGFRPAPQPNWRGREGVRE